MDKWHSIETAPENERFLGWNGDTIHIFRRSKSPISNGFVSQIGVKVHPPTHWMPLPDEPNKHPEKAELEISEIGDTHFFKVIPTQNRKSAGRGVITTKP